LDRYRDESEIVYLHMLYMILYRLGAKSLSKKAHDKRTKSNPAVDLKADDKTSSSPSSGSKSTAVYATDHKGTTTSSPSTTTYTDDKYSRK